MMKKTKKCRNCGEQFSPFTSLEKFCRKTDCQVKRAMLNLEKLKQNQKKKDRQELLEKKEKLKTLSDYSKELQKLVNTFVRLRDRNKRCVSCDKILKAKFDAGHFFSVGQFPSVRFSLSNIHGQCVMCNQFKGGNLHEYRKRITTRITEEEFKELELNAYQTRKFMKHELIEMIEEMKVKIKQKKLL
jgi:hypothetical protein